METPAVVVDQRPESQICGTVQIDEERPGLRGRGHEQVNPFFRIEASSNCFCLSDKSAWSDFGDNSGRSHLQAFTPHSHRGALGRRDQFLPKIFPGRAQLMKYDL